MQANRLHPVFAAELIGADLALPPDGALLDFASQPRFICAHSWRPDDLLLWDNRRTLHGAMPFDDLDQNATCAARRSAILGARRRLSETKPRSRPEWDRKRS